MMSEELDCFECLFGIFDKQLLLATCNKLGFSNDYKVIGSHEYNICNLHYTILIILHSLSL